MHSNTYGGAMSDLKYFKSPYKLQSGKKLQQFYGANINLIRGRGLGSFLRGTYSSLRPVLLQALPFLKNIARHALEGSAHVLKENLETNRSLKELAKEEASRRFRNLTEEARNHIFKGSGLRRRKSKKKAIKHENNPIPAVIKALLVRRKTAGKKAARKNRQKNKAKKQNSTEEKTSRKNRRKNKLKRNNSSENFFK